MPQLLLKYKFSILVAAFIFFLCAKPTLPPVFDAVRDFKVCVETESVTVTYTDIRDSLGHFLSYVLLSFVVAFESSRCGISLSSKLMFCLSFLIPSLYGGLIEILQDRFFPPRSAEWSDWIEDSLGALLGYVSARFSLPKINVLINK